MQKQNFKSTQVEKYTDVRSLDYSTPGREFEKQEPKNHKPPKPL